MYYRLVISVLGFGNRGNGRHRSCRYRQRHFIDSLRRRVARDRLAVDKDVLQLVIRQQADLEIQRIGLRSGLISRRDLDGRGARRRRRLGDSNRLLLFLFLHLNYRSGLRAVRQLYFVVVFGRTETLQGCTVDRDTRQLRVARSGFLELDLIGRCRLAVLRLHGDDGRRAGQVSIRDRYLAAGERTSRESDGRSSGVGDRTCTADSLDSRNRSSRFA